MHGGVLCRELPDGQLDAVFCPGSTGNVVLGKRVRSVAPSTFAGTHRIDVYKRQVLQLIGRQDEEHAAVRAALLQLAGGVQVARAHRCV